MKHSRRVALPALAFTMSALAACGGGSSGESPAALPTPGQVAFSTDTYSVDEASATVAVSVARIGGSAGQITVQITADDGSASSGSDFVALTETLTFADGDSASRTVDIELTDDDIDEPNETILLSLSNATGGATLASPSTAEVVINDDEPDEFEVSVSISGLSGTGLTLRNNDGDDLPIDVDGNYAFSTTLFEGDAYDVTVSVKPWEPSQTCSIANAVGTIVDADVDNIVVRCEDAVLQSLVVSRHVSTNGIEQNDLYLVREDGELPIQLTATDDANEWILAAYEDWIIYTRSDQVAPDTGIHSVRRDGTGDLLLSQYPEARLAGITETGIAVYSSDGNLYSVDVTGVGGHSDLLVSVNKDMATHVSTDGRIVFTRTVGSQTDLYAIDIDGSNLTPLAVDPKRETLSNVTPSGRAIYFLHADDGRRDLYSVSLDGFGLAAISEEPDADQYVVQALETGVQVVKLSYDNGDEELHAVRDDGSSSQRLAVNPGGLTFATAVPGERIIYETPAGSGGSNDVYIVAQDGFGNLQLAASDDDEFFAGLTADGAAIVERHTNGQSDLARVELDGSRETAIALTPLNDVLVGVDADSGNGRLILARGTPSERNSGSQSAVGSSLVSIRQNGSDERLLAENAIPARIGSRDTNSTIVTRYGSVFYFDDDDHLWRVGTDRSNAIPLTPFDDLVTIEWLLED